MEHLQCKNNDHLIDDFSRHNINWNAGTWDYKIMFYFTGIESRLAKYRDEYLKRLCDFNITEEILELEKKIVIEEYTDSFNSQSNSHYLNLVRKLYNYYSPIGELSAIQNITLDDIREFYNIQYSKPSFIVNISKDCEYKNDLIIFNNDHDKYLQPLVELKNNKDFIYQESNEYKDKSSIIYKSKVQTENIPYLKFICNMFGSGLKSSLYQEIREKHGLCYGVSFFYDQYNNVSGTVTLMAETSNDNVNKFKDITYQVLKNSNYLTQNRFDIVRDEYLAKRETNDILKHNHTILTDDYNLSTDSILDNLTLDECIEVFNNQLRYEDWYISVDSEEFKK